LKGSLAASAVAMAGGCAAPGAGSGEANWALLSDIHIAADPRHVCGNVNMTRNLGAVAEEVLAWLEPVSGVLISGDLAFASGETEDYAAVLGLLRPMRQHRLPIHLALGNHDQREHFWSTLPDERTAEPGLPERQAAIVRTAYANWFVLDSLITPQEVSGRLGDAQRQWLARALDANTDKPALIVLHHDLNPGIATDYSLKDTPELLEILRPRRQVKACVFGHTHFWNVSQDESGVWLVNLPPVAYVFVTGLPNGWVRATLRAEGARLELRCLDHTRQDHGHVVNLVWRA
jgi:3',5'-cyclic AMP phosphodiesterase CpdA